MPWTKLLTFKGLAQSKLNKSSLPSSRSIAGLGPKCAVFKIFNNPRFLVFKKLISYNLRSSVLYLLTTFRQSENLEKRNRRRTRSRKAEDEEGEAYIIWSSFSFSRTFRMNGDGLTCISSHTSSYLLRTPAGSDILRTQVLCLYKLWRKSRITRLKAKIRFDKHRRTMEGRYLAWPWVSARWKQIYAEHVHVCFAWCKCVHLGLFSPRKPEVMHKLRPPIQPYTARPKSSQICVSCVGKL